MYGSLAIEVVGTSKVVISSPLNGFGLAFAASAAQCTTFAFLLGTLPACHRNSGYESYPAEHRIQPLHVGDELQAGRPACVIR